MRRAQTFKHYARPSMSSAADDLGVLREAGEETIEDVLRQQLLEKSKENEKVCIIRQYNAFRAELICN